MHTGNTNPSACLSKAALHHPHVSCHVSPTLDNRQGCVVRMMEAFRALMKATSISKGPGSGPSPGTHGFLTLCDQGFVTVTYRDSREHGHGLL